VRRALAPYSVDIVTTRPSSGDYLMIVVGGDSGALGFVPNLLGITPSVCDAANRNRISLEFDVGQNAIQQASNVLSDVALMVGLAATTKASNCTNRMLQWPEGSSLLCSFDPMGPTHPDHTPGLPNCGRIPAQDEPALLREALGCRN
jgi:hypothetical protein